jgi:hypothetical protein
MVRPFTEQDIPQVAELHYKVWPVAPSMSPELMDSYQDYFRHVFLQHPWWKERLGSLVYQERGGGIVGFFGAVPLQMSMNGAAIQARVGSQFIVDPARRGWVGLKLLTTFLEGPQDLSFADMSNSTSRTLWERLGATTAVSYSMRWMAVLRPCRFGLFTLGKMHLLPRVMKRTLTPIARLLDSLAARIPKNPLRPTAPLFSGENLPSESLAAYLLEFAKEKKLRPEYDPHSFEWLMQQADRLRRKGSLQKILVRTRNQQIAGWYVYYLNPGGLSEVVQVHARPGFASGVLDHLFDHAWRQGASALSGRVEPGLMTALANRRSVFYFLGHQWVLLHSRRPELVSAFDRGDVFLSRLEGEWCLQFQ